MTRLPALLLTLLLAAPAWAVPAPEPKELPGPVDVVGEWELDWHPGWGQSVPQGVRFHAGGWGQCVEAGWWQPFAWEQRGNTVRCATGEQHWVLRLAHMGDGTLGGTAELNGQVPARVRLTPRGWPRP